MERRQQFLTEEYYNSMIEFYGSAESFWLEQELDEDEPGQAACLRARNIIVDRLSFIMLQYTAGKPVVTLVPALEQLIVDYERHQVALAVYHGEPSVSPLSLDDSLCDYEECLWVVSLCVLLHQHTLLKRFVGMIDAGGYSNSDVLYEDLVRKILPGRFEVDEFYFFAYASLIESVYAHSAEEASGALKRYCAGWYAGFDDAQAHWYDAHLTMDDTDGAYIGYWALEAAAIAYLYNIDDSDVVHMVYPRDLVEYARNHKPEPLATEGGKVYAGQPCFRTGYWFSPAQSNSRRFFTAGEIMPEFKGSSWGATIWYWSGEE
ncbi:PoNe immunity protein domain-containing protein [Pseudomonas sp. NPDC089406]|uniref:PoNe immunity protein domain-containing protein n=1 Tax=Pseudomonas sp. NPDC089406 TaxID=3364463 RepID=UPI00384C6955